MKNANFTKKLYSRDYATETYIVDNIEGMTEQEIIDACDANNFGGRVCGHMVTVYID